jgi:hypothetical protein
MSGIDFIIYLRLFDAKILIFVVGLGHALNKNTKYK